ncbi:helix-turn-helix transcriptional regulator [Streptomyces sp. AM8-1-1]|uniref:helix-turn-helix domain-containing protein n=1 Tax=Streptomyces sp. AM8-1-1 TaxID=3075825 RepID=UPI0028C50A94|nr:helix-turn-helix transcriptional regulator [Streptomyces sp. AM8-1-1]WNO70154.1 helix-turn-helix transcriptional regulator [Streptomyces sp. AM8-1-1]WNO76962.1 helix-turn-helix transcriptional regulator [Streptomyces sp. AM8-1-1]
MNPLPLARNIAESVQALAQTLLASEYGEQDLEALLRHADELTREVDYYICAAVQDARRKGTTWEKVAAAASVSAGTARSRWAEKTVRRRLERRAGEQLALRQRDPATATAPPRTDGQGGVPPGERSASKLAAALSHLHRNSGLTIRQVAQSTDLSPSYVSRIMSGERLPNWSVVEMLASLFEGDSGELAMLWENAHGMTPPARQPLPDAAARLNAALRGLYLAAASPSPTRIHQVSGGTLSMPIIKDILAGRTVPDWRTTVSFVQAVGGTPTDIRPLWESVHYAFLVFLDPVEGDPPLPPPFGAGDKSGAAREDQNPGERS